MIDLAQRLHLLLLCLLLVFSAAVYPCPSEATEASRTPVQILKPHQLPINAKSAVLMDVATGQVLVAYKEHTRIPPASFAKLLTLYIVFDTLKQGKLRLDDKVYISEKAWRTGGSKMFVEVGTKVPLRELIKGIAVVSGNDACVAVAEHLYGSTSLFAQAMNAFARKIGMQESHFTNPHGLPHREQYTTALDMALLARSYLLKFPEALQFHSMQAYTYSGIRQRNRNGLLRKDPSVDGLKTGYIAQAGYHLLATAKRHGWRLLAVIMGAKSPAVREEEAMKLLNYGYRNFVLLALFHKGQVLAELPVWKGKKGSLPVVATADGVVVVPREYSTRVHNVAVLPAELTAPIQRGQQLGRAEIRLETQTLKTIPLAAAQEIPRAGLVRIVTQDLYLLVRNYKKTLLLLTGGILPIAAVVVLISLRGRRRRRRPVRFQL